MWCGKCGAEYRPGFTHCDDCQLDLVAEPPAPVSVAAVAPRVDHDLTEYDLIELSDEQTKLLELLLRGADVPFKWEPPRRLLVANAVVAAVDEILDFVDASADDSAPPADSLGKPPSSQRAASPGRRFGGWFIDGLLLSVGFTTMRWLWGPSFATWSALQLAYAIVPVAIWGKTPGKLAMRTRVVRVDGASVPGWRVATIRAVVPMLPDLVLGAVSIATGLTGWVYVIGGFLWTCFVYAPVLGVDRRGRHDIVAGTIVLREPVDLRPR